MQAQKVVVACLGDFLNSDRRLDELLSNATNRSRATLLAADILRAFLLDLRSAFPLEVYGITGNESRVTQELGWSDPLATDSYDLMIYGILQRSLAGVDGIGFCGFRAHELLFEVLGRTFLCLHGHQIGANVQKSVQEIAGRYAAQGITVDYTLFGHLHATAIGDFHARNASLVGSNAYSESGLNFCSKAAQNVHIVTPTAIDGVKVDLQDTSTSRPYPLVGEWEACAPQSGGVELAAAITSLAAAVRTLADSQSNRTPGPTGLGSSPWSAAPWLGGDGPMAAWQERSVVELRALLRGLPVDRRSLPAPIEKLRRAELVEALQQLEALGH
jgi:predicted phosphodiesterase